MRTGLHVSRLAGGLLLPLLAAACGGDDLLLPGTGSPTGLQAVSGDGQEAEVGATLPDPLVVRASDASGRPVQGTLIVFRFDGDGGGEVAPDTARTDFEGRAAAEVQLGTTSGAQLVKAAVVEGPADLVVTFQLTAVDPSNPGDGGGGGGGGGDGDDDDEVDDGGDNGNDGGGDGGDGDDDDDEDRSGKGGKGKGRD
jgi:hypothetical protein